MPLAGVVRKLATPATSAEGPGTTRVRYRYFHNSNYEVNRDRVPALTGYREGDQLTLAYEAYIAAEINPIDRENGLKICDALFHAFNAPWERPNDYAGPNMGVGDVITLYVDGGGVLSFACERLCFREATAEVDKSLWQPKPRPHGWIRSGEKLREYLLTKKEDVGLTQEEENILFPPIPENLSCLESTLGEVEIVNGDLACVDGEGCDVPDDDPSYANCRAVIPLGRGLSH